MGAGAPISWMERQTDQLIDGQTYPRVVCKLKQVTRGHNIVTDGWAGAATSHPHPTPHPAPLPTQSLKQKDSKTIVSLLFDSCSRMDGWTDQRTD